MRACVNLKKTMEVKLLNLSDTNDCIWRSRWLVLEKNAPTNISSVISFQYSYTREKKRCKMWTIKKLDVRPSQNPVRLHIHANLFAFFIVD